MDRNGSLHVSALNLFIYLLHIFFTLPVVLSLTTYIPDSDFDCILCYRGPWLGVTCTSGIVTGLDLPAKSLAGNLPDALKWVVNLTSVKLNGNNFIGSLPPSWSSITGLTLLYLQSNALTGTLPAQWSSLQRISQLYLANNRLTGTIPSVWAATGGMQVLKSYHLHNNDIAHDHY